MATHGGFGHHFRILDQRFVGHDAKQLPALRGSLPINEAAPRRVRTKWARRVRVALLDSRATKTMLFGLLVFAAIIVVVFSFVGTYNRLVAAADKARRAWNELDALLRQRHDEIPKVIEVCEPHLAHERALFDRLLETRAAVFAARQTRDADALSRAERSLRAAAAELVIDRAAKVPALAASPAFGLLRQRHATLDLELAQRRDGYNSAVRDYNAAIGRLPGSLVALVGEFPPLRPLEFEPSGT
jgi:LemA protein